MKRDAIRRLEAQELAKKGYPRGWYGWQKRGWLTVWIPGPIWSDNSRAYHLPAGTSKRALREALAELPSVGPCRDFRTTEQIAHKYLQLQLSLA